jgi:hypothetical protein
MADHVAVSDPKSDALERAFRTLWQGFIVDALILIGTGLSLMVADADISSPTFWVGVGVLVGKSFLVSIASYLARLKLAPHSTQ